MLSVGRTGGGGTWSLHVTLLFLIKELEPAPSPRTIHGCHQKQRMISLRSCSGRAKGDLVSGKVEMTDSLTFSIYPRGRLLLPSTEASLDLRTGCLNPGSRRQRRPSQPSAPSPGLCSSLTSSHTWQGWTQKRSKCKRHAGFWRLYTKGKKRKEHKMPH